MRLWAATADGVWTLEENDAVWTVRHMQLQGRAFWTVAVSPHQADVIFAGADGHGLFRSVNGGGSWRPMSRGLESPYVHSLAFDAADRRVIYAATLPAALYRSDDGGETWEPLATLPSGDAARRPPQVVCHPTQGGLVFVIGGDGALQRSANRGQTWSRSALPGNLHQAAVTPAVMLAAGDDGLWRSADDGETWALTHAHAACAVSAWRTPTAVLAAGLLPASAAATTLSGSHDGGRTWFPAPGATPPDLRQITLTPTLILGIASTGDLWLAPQQGLDTALAWSPFSAELPPVFASGWRA